MRLFALLIAALCVSACSANSEPHSHDTEIEHPDHSHSSDDQPAPKGPGFESPPELADEAEGNEDIARDSDPAENPA